MVAQLEQVGVRELEDLDRGERGPFHVEDERRVPGRDDKIIGEIGDARPKHLLALLRGKRLPLAAQDLRNRRAVPLEHLV